MADEKVFSCMQVVMHNIRLDDVSHNIVYSNNVSSDLLVLKFDILNLLLTLPEIEIRF